jgi:hypothetical protein
VCIEVIVQSVSRLLWLTRSINGEICLLACHWTQGLRVQARSRRWMFKHDKNPQDTFFRGFYSV